MSIMSTGSNQRDYYDFNESTLPWANPRTVGSHYVSFDVSVKNSETCLVCGAAWNQCKIRYNEIYTPMYIDTVPSNVAFGMTINMIMNPNRAHYDLAEN